MSKTGSTRGSNAPNIKKTNFCELEKAKKVGVKGSPLIWQRTALSSNTPAYSKIVPFELGFSSLTTPTYLFYSCAVEH